MAQTRNHLPKNLQNTAAKKAWSKKVLKHYVVKRLQLWNSTKGTLNRAAKITAAFFTLGKYGSLKTSDEILQDCNGIKTDIEAAREYGDYTKLIKKLHDMAVAAKEEQVPGASNPSLRTDTYYAIIAMLHEIIKDDFTQEYERDIDRIMENLTNAQRAYTGYYNGGRPREQIYAEINDALRQLVLLGHRPIYDMAFEVHRNLFPSLFTPIKGRFSFIEEEAALKYKGIIEVQLEQEQEIKANLEGLAKPNINIPYVLQPDFPIIFCYYELKKSLGFCTKYALQEDEVENGKSFHELYKFEKDKFIADNLAEARQPREDDNHSPQHDSQFEVRFLPMESNDNPAPPPPSATQVEYDIEGSYSEQDDFAVPEDVPLNNNNVIPLHVSPQDVIAPVPEVTQPTVSALGTFGNAAAAAAQQRIQEEDLAPAEIDDVEIEERSDELAANHTEDMESPSPPVKTVAPRRTNRKRR